MEIIVIVLLGVIAYMLWRIYHQKEEEKIANEMKQRSEFEKSKSDAADETNYQWKKEDFGKDYPNLIENMNWASLKTYGRDFFKMGYNPLSVACNIYLKEANHSKHSSLNRIASRELDELFYSLWNLSEELLEHLEKYHKSTKYEYEIAILNYWSLVAKGSDSLVGKDIETIKNMFQTSPFTDIQKITSWFPQKSNHPNKEISCIDKDGMFPRKSKGSIIIKDRLKILGV